MIQSVQRTAQSTTAPQPQTAQVQRPVAPTAPTPPVAPGTPAAPQPGEWRPSQSETDAIRNALSPCWAVDPGRRDARSLLVELRVFLTAEGAVRDAEVLTRPTNPAHRAAAEAARRAVLNPACSRLPIPADRLGRVPTMLIVFDPRDY
jgi:hypothetical protein